MSSDKKSIISINTKKHRAKKGLSQDKLSKLADVSFNTITKIESAVIPPSPWWLAGLPNDVDNLRVKQFQTNRTGNDENPAQDGDVWLRVEKKNIDPHTPLPDVLIEWVGEVGPLEAPKAKEKIDRKIRFDQEDMRVREFESFRKKFTKSAPIQD